MYKKLKYTFYLSFLLQVSLHASEAKELPQSGSIEGATHYHLWSNSRDESKTVAFFYGYDAESKQAKLLDKYVVHGSREEAQKKFNSALDQNQKLPTIKLAIISNCIKRGRCVSLQDEEGNTVDTLHRYSGTLDLRAPENSEHIIQPPHLLDSLEKVTETKTQPAVQLKTLKTPSTQTETIIYKKSNT